MPVKAPWALVTPASRGIGLAVARRILATTSIPVVATCRSSTSSVRDSILADIDGVDPSRLHVLKLDVVDESSISDAAREASSLFPPSSSYLHIGFALPGILHPEKSPAQIDANAALETFRINTLGPMLLLKHFSTFLPRKSAELEDHEGLPPQAVWATLSARVGSISDNSLGGWYSYRASKAGVNQLTKTFDNYLRTSAGDKAMAVALHPGTVKTGLSKEFWANVKEGKLFSPEYSAEKLVDVVRSRTTKDRGLCWDWKGEEIPP